jgi:PII-like signaling protein
MTDHLLLTIYLDETDTAGDLPLYEAIVRRLLRYEIAGATVQRGIMGFGAHGRVHRKRLFGVSDDRPIVISAIDSADKIRAVAKGLHEIVREGLVTIQPVEVVS